MRVDIRYLIGGDLGGLQAATHGAVGAVAGGGRVREVMGVGGGRVGGDVGVDWSAAGEGVVEFLVGGLEVGIGGGRGGETEGFFGSVGKCFKGEVRLKGKGNVNRNGKGGSIPPKP